MTAVEFYHSELKKILYNVIVTPEQVMEMADALAQAKEMEKQQKDDYAIDFVKWVLQNEEKIISIEYNTGEEAIKGLLEIFKNK